MNESYEKDEAEGNFKSSTEVKVMVCTIFSGILILVGLILAGMFPA